MALLVEHVVGESQGAGCQQGALDDRVLHHLLPHCALRKRMVLATSGAELLLAELQHLGVRYLRARPLGINPRHAEDAPPHLGARRPLDPLPEALDGREAKVALTTPQRERGGREVRERAGPPVLGVADDVELVYAVTGQNMTLLSATEASTNASSATSVATATAAHMRPRR